MQKQEDGRDCGVFAIATITAIAHGYDPIQMKFDQTVIKYDIAGTSHSGKGQVATPDPISCGLQHPLQLWEVPHRRNCKETEDKDEGG